jgi:hypothetical protein
MTRLYDSSRRDRLLAVREAGHIRRSRSSEEAAAELVGATRRRTIAQRRTMSRRCVRSRTRKLGRSGVEVGAVPPESPHMSESSSSSVHAASDGAARFTHSRRVRTLIPLLVQCMFEVFAEL